MLAKENEDTVLVGKPLKGFKKQKDFGVVIKMKDDEGEIQNYDKKKDVGGEESKVKEDKPTKPKAADKIEEVKPAVIESENTLAMI